MVLPIVCAAGMDSTPSMFVTARIDGGVISFVTLIATVGASMPVPAIGQTSGLGGTSVATSPDARFGVHVALCQSGELSVSTPKFDPPTTSR